MVNINPEHPRSDTFVPSPAHDNGQALLRIEGMHCDHCVRKVAEALLGVEGVEDAEVDLEDHSARLRFMDADQASDEALSRAVSDAGFRVTEIRRENAARAQP